MNKRKRFSFGPGLIITAAFIGPGTITTCTIAGADFGYTLLWTLLFACVATYILQEMCGRLGLIGGLGLGSAISSELPAGFIRIGGIVLVVSAIGIGNAAYQTGNIIGAALGLSSLTGVGISYWPFIIGSLAFILLWFGSYKSLEIIFAGLVAVMGICFILTAILVKPDVGGIVSGLFTPRISDDNIYIALGLVGTTIVPYNLFLYSAVVKEKWSGAESLPAARMDLFVAVLIGGLISAAVVTTSSAAFFGKGVEITDAGSMALQLEPLLGGWARAAISIGLFVAGMSSAMTAPLAAAYAISGTFRWKNSLKDNRFRMIWISVLLTGVIFASIGLKPLPAIIFAQAANGLLLPVIVIFLLYIMNKKRLLGENANSLKANLLGIFIIIIAFVLGVKGIVTLF